MYVGKNVAHNLAQRLLFEKLDLALSRTHPFGTNVLWVSRTKEIDTLSNAFALFGWLER
jgi:hypothetical protein